MTAKTAIYVVFAAVGTAMNVPAPVLAAAAAGIFGPDVANAFRKKNGE